MLFAVVLFGGFFLFAVSFVSLLLFLCFVVVFFFETGSHFLALATH